MSAKKNTKTPTKSRTAQTGLKKKIGIPKWAIFATVLVVVSIGIALVYNSYAGTPTKGLWCYSGTRNCHLSRQNGTVLKQQQVLWTEKCPSGLYWKPLNPKPNEGWICVKK